MFSTDRMREAGGGMDEEGLSTCGMVGWDSRGQRDKRRRGGGGREGTRD